MCQIYLSQVDRGIEVCATAPTSIPAGPAGGAKLCQSSQNAAAAAAQCNLDSRTDQPDDDPLLQSAEWAGDGGDPEVIIDALVELQLPKVEVNKALAYFERA